MLGAKEPRRRRRLDDPLVASPGRDVSPCARAVGEQEAVADRAAMRARLDVPDRTNTSARSATVIRLFTWEGNVATIERSFAPGLAVTSYCQVLAAAAMGATTLPV
jgi:hypothetical protein